MADGTCPIRAPLEDSLPVFRRYHWDGTDLETYLHNLGEVFSCLQAAGLELKASKCTLLQKKVRYLGHIVSGKGVTTAPDKITAIRDWPQPRNIQEGKPFLCTVGYYYHFVDDDAQLAGPLTELSSKNVPWK